MRPLRVGLTGGIGAGKTLALAEFRRRGAAVVDVDEIAREQARPGGPAFGRVVKAFGPAALAADGTLDRAKLAAIVFRSAAARRKLERLTHPLVLRELSRRLKAPGKPVFVAAVPLLFEAGLERRFDVTVTVEAPQAQRRRRVARRDGLTPAQVGARMRAQLPARERERRADVVLRNDAAKATFLRKVGEYQAAFALLRHGAQGAR